MSGPYFEVEKILKKRHNATMGRVEYLIKWKGFGDTANSWEPESNVTKDLIREFKITCPDRPAISRSSSAQRLRPKPSSVSMPPPVHKTLLRRATCTSRNAKQVSAEPINTRKSCAVAPGTSHTSSPVSPPPPARQPLNEFTKQMIAELEAADAKREGCVSEQVSDQELEFAAGVYGGVVPERVRDAVRLENVLFLLFKWTDGSEDLVPAKYANRLFPGPVIAFYESSIRLHDLVQAKATASQPQP